MKIVTSYQKPDLDGVACMYAYSEFLNLQGENTNYFIYDEPKCEVDIVCDLFNINLEGLKIEDIDESYEFVVTDCNGIDSVHSIIKPEKIVEIIDHHSLSRYLPQYTQSKLLEELYKVFVDVQKAWMNFDYNKLKELCSDELFESYKSDLEVLKQKNGQNIMDNFKLYNSSIDDIKYENDKIYVDMILNVSFIDYVIDTNTKDVIRGNKDRHVNNTYHLVFACNCSNKSICPNCGAKINGSDCEYCHTHINELNSSFVLIEKKRI